MSLSATGGDSGCQDLSDIMSIEFQVSDESVVVISSTNKASHDHQIEISTSCATTRVRHV